MTIFSPKFTPGRTTRDTLNVNGCRAVNVIDIMQIIRLDQ